MNVLRFVAVANSSELRLAFKTHLTHALEICKFWTLCSDFSELRSFFISVAALLVFVEPFHLDFHETKASADISEVDSTLGS